MIIVNLMIKKYFHMFLNMVQESFPLAHFCQNFEKIKNKKKIKIKIYNNIYSNCFIV